MDPCPFSEAHIRAVKPSVLRTFREAPARIRESTMDPSPLSEAHSRAVAPYSLSPLIISTPDPNPSNYGKNQWKGMKYDIKGN